MTENKPAAGGADRQVATGTITVVSVWANQEPIDKIHDFVPDEYGENCLHVDDTGKTCERVPHHPRHLALFELDVIDITYPITKEEAA